MKQVIFAIALLAMASLTGCLTDDESSVDTTTDTKSDNTGNTNDNSNDNTDSGDGGMVDPVGADGGVTIPEDSSVFMDSGSHHDMGSYECNNPDKGTDEWSDDEEEFTCNYTYYQNDFFKNNINSEDNFTSMTYIDVDGISNNLDFYGWVNKTGQTVTIEPLVYPDRGYFQLATYADLNGDGEQERVPKLSKNINQPVNREVCFYYSSYNECEITFYGVNNLQYNAIFSLGKSIGGANFAIDTDNDGVKDTIKEERFYQIHTITFDLPFEPYGFEIGKVYTQYGVKYNDEEGNPTSVYRIF